MVIIEWVKHAIKREAPLLCSPCVMNSGTHHEYVGIICPSLRAHRTVHAYGREISSIDTVKFRGIGKEVQN